MRARLAAPIAILDVRLDEEYRGELTAPAGYPPLAQRAGHIAGAIWAPWEGTLDPDGRFLPLDLLRSRCARLGFERARNHDGGWAGWGPVVGARSRREGRTEETNQLQLPL